MGYGNSIIRLLDSRRNPSLFISKETKKRKVDFNNISNSVFHLAHYLSLRFETNISFVWNFWCKKFVNKIFVYAYRVEEENDYKKYFKTIEIFETKDHDYSKITPMYFLKKL